MADDDAEAIDPEDIEVIEPDDEGDQQSHFTVADIEFDESHSVVRANRTLTMEFDVKIGLEVIEPPMVFDAEIQQAMKRLLLNAITGHRLGTLVSYEVNVRRQGGE